MRGRKPHADGEEGVPALLGAQAEGALAAQAQALAGLRALGQSHVRLPVHCVGTDTAAYIHIFTLSH